MQSMALMERQSTSILLVQNTKSSDLRVSHPGSLEKTRLPGKQGTPTPPALNATESFDSLIVLGQVTMLLTP